MPRVSSPKPVEQLTYEAAFAELQTIVEALEEGERPLDEATSLYERGQALIKHCSKLLDEAELKVSQLSGSVLADPNEG